MQRNATIARLALGTLFVSCLMLGSSKEANAQSGTLSTTIGTSTCTGYYTKTIDFLAGPVYATFTYTIGGSWLTPSTHPAWPVYYNFVCTPRYYSSPTNPNDPNSNQPCTVTVSMSSGFTAQGGSADLVLLDGYIVYQLDNQTQKIHCIVENPTVKPGFVKTYYGTYGEYTAFRQGGVNQYKVKSSTSYDPAFKEYTVATTSIW